MTTPWGVSCDPYFSLQQTRRPTANEPPQSQYHTNYPQAVPGFYNPSLSVPRSSDDYGGAGIPTSLLPGGGRQATRPHPVTRTSNDIRFQPGNPPPFIRPQTITSPQSSYLHPICDERLSQTDSPVAPPIYHSRSAPPPRSSSHQLQQTQTPGFVNPYDLPLPGTVPNSPVYLHSMTDTTNGRALQFHVPYPDESYSAHQHVSYPQPHPYAAVMSPSSYNQPAFPFPQAHTRSAPALPPKDALPPLARYSNPLALPPKPPEMYKEKDEQMLRAMELSKKESDAQRQQTLSNQEAELNRALEESLKLSDSPWSPVHMPSTSAEPSAAPAESSLFSEAPTTIFSSPRSAEQQILDDEALARRIQEEEELELSTQHNRQPGAHAVSKLSPVGNDLSLPNYHDVVTSPISRKDFNLMHASPEKPTSMSLSIPMANRPVSASGSVASGPSPARSRMSSIVRSPQSTSGGIPETTSVVVASPHQPPSETNSSDPANVPTPSMPYIDDELLLGVSLGFSAPTISPVPEPMKGDVPNVIALQYGRCSPFHIQTPSWRDMLKLMARMSHTRVEPAIEAMTVVKTTMYLRVVVQFAKVHASSNQWSTIVYMSIDHPVPAGAAASWKHHNNDTSILPWSYTLSPLPVLLRDGSDAPLHKYYTVPSTPRTPYPTLPITFPNLALYLAQVLEDSRMASHDGSSGMRRLGKWVDTFYKSERIDNGDDEHTGLFSRLIGRRQVRDRNEATFELVTPFVPDEHGG